MISEIWKTRKNFSDLISTLKGVQFFPTFKNEIKVSFFSRHFVTEPHIFYAGQGFGSISFLEIRLTSYQKLCFSSLRSNRILKT